MKYYFLIFLSIISLNSHSYAENYCESLTYTKIKTHLIKCSFKNIDLENSNLEEFSINNQSSTLFVDYKDINKTLYILAVIRNVKLDESFNINLFDLEFQNITFRNKGFAKIKGSFNITDKINEYINDFKKYISNKFDDDDVLDQMENFTNNLIDNISKTFKKNKDDVKVYSIRIVHRLDLKHCIDIKKGSIKCLKFKI